MVTQAALSLAGGKTEPVRALSVSAPLGHRPRFAAQESSVDGAPAGGAVGARYAVQEGD